MGKLKNIIKSIKKQDRLTMTLYYITLHDDIILNNDIVKLLHDSYSGYYGGYIETLSNNKLIYYSYND